MEEGGAIAFLVCGGLLILVAICVFYKLRQNRSKFKKQLDEEDNNKDKDVSDVPSVGDETSASDSPIKKKENDYNSEVDLKVDNIREESAVKISRLEDRIRELETRPTVTTPPKIQTTTTTATNDNTATFLFSPQPSQPVAPTVVMASHDLGDPVKQAEWQHAVIKEMLQNGGNPEVHILSQEDSKIMI